MFRDISGERFGYMAHLDLSRYTQEDRAIDPAVAPALALIDRHGPLQPGDVVLYTRSWMHVEKHQAIATPAVNLTTMNSFLRTLTHPNIAWNFVAMHDAAGYEPLLTGINWIHAPAADFEVDGRRIGVFAHDWRREPPSAWIAARLGMQPFATMPFAAAAGPPNAVADGRIDRCAFAQAVRDALRDFQRSERLLINPLQHTELLRAAAAGGSETPDERLQALLRDAVHALKTHPRYDKLYRALWHTYIEPLASQEKVAERLDLPFSTYRYHLTKGIERIVDGLWHRESRRSSQASQPLNS